MKKIYKTLILALIGVNCFTSCNKDIEGEYNNDSNKENIIKMYKLLMNIRIQRRIISVYADVFSTKRIISTVLMLKIISIK